MTSISRMARGFGRPRMVGSGCGWDESGTIDNLERVDDQPLSHLSGEQDTHATLGAPTSSGDVIVVQDAGATAGQIAYGVLATVSMAASAYHGYKRNDVSGGSPLGWGLVWGLMGSIFPVITPVIAVAQGYAKPEK